MRRIYIDNARWITVTLVVIYHIIFMFNGVETNLVIGPFHPVQYQDVYLYIVYPWFMLLLFVISGMCAGFYLERHSGKEFLKSKTVKLLVPSTLGLFVFHWILGYLFISNSTIDISGQPKWGQYIIMSFAGTSVLWYIQLLWFFSILLLGVRKLERDRLYRLGEKTNIVILLLFTGVIYGAAQILNTPVVLVYRFGIYGTGFLIGYFCLSHDNVMERLSKYALPLGVAAAILGGFFITCFWGQSYAAYSVLKTPICNCYAWIAVLAILAFMKKHGNFENKFTHWMNRKSWGLYIFHYLALSLCAYRLHPYATELPPIIVYVLTGIFGFAGAFILYEFISRIPIIRWCVLGICKAKNTPKGQEK